MSAVVAPSARKSRISDTQMRWPRMQGFPKHTFGSIVIRFRSSSFVIAGTLTSKHSTCKQNAAGWVQLFDAHPSKRGLGGAPGYGTRAEYPRRAAFPKYSQGAIFSHLPPIFCSETDGFVLYSVIYSQVIRVIVSFSVSNFRSFSSEETFSLVASGRLSAHPEHTVPIPDSKERVLRAVVLYGANGAGKSNLFKALQYVESVALNSRKKGSGTGRTAFRFGGKRRDEPSSFDLQFIVQGKLYRFGFRVDDQRITEEWLAQVIGEREVTIYERLTDDDGKVTIDPQGIKGEKLSALAKVGGPPNQSFLATINVTLNAPDLGDQLGGILMWFRRDLN